MDIKPRESIVEIGQPTPLVGVLTEGRSDTDTALILLNSGIMHRVGSCRLSVRLARELTAATGISCLRFDFSGVGDSCPRRAGGVDFDQAAAAEVIEVMDYLRRLRGIRRFIVYGLCSGARIACSVAEQDARVVGVIQLDGYCSPTAKSWLHYYWRRLCSLEAWRKRTRRWLNMESPEAKQGSVLSGAKADFEVPAFAEDPGADKVAQQLQTLMDRNIKLHSVFTGRGPDYCYHEQFRDCFSGVDFGENLSLHYFPDASHIFTEPLYQAQMIDGVLRWLQPLVEHRPSHHSKSAESARLREALA